MSHPPVILGEMEQQLLLLDPPPDDWRLDEHTRQIGRRGVQQARDALRQRGQAAA